jgi:hypothetical protein
VKARRLVYLHGRSGSADSEMRDEPMFAELAKLGRRAPVIRFCAVGGHSPTI